ncbi:rod shape-determining protein [Patescibacteria group bacterium]
MAFVKKIGIDLGTANTLVYVPKKGIILNEPSVVTISPEENKIISVGAEAKGMVGRTPDILQAVQPLRDGVIADYRATEAMLKYFINKATGGVRFVRPEVMVSVPAGVTSTERRAVIDATVKAGAKSAYVIKEPVAAAIGAGVPISESAGNMIVDIGGGTTEIAVISLGGIVAVTSVRVGGNKLDTSIVDYIRKEHGLSIGIHTAEKLKMKLGSAVPMEENQQLDVRGRDLVSGLPQTITVTSHGITEAMQEELYEIIKAIKSVLQETPPELASDIIDKGMIISGGGALLQNIDRYIEEHTGVSCHIAEDPLLCVAKGVGIALTNLEDYKRSILSVK